MGTLINEIGNTYGRLTVIRRATLEEAKGKKGGYWVCQCSCGNEIVVLGTWLRNGNTQSCGCLQRQRAAESNIQRGGGDLTGHRFGYLTVLGFDHAEVNKQNKNIRYWKCQCECGNIVIVSTQHLNSGHTKSCGCYNKKRIRQTQLINEVGNRYGRLTVLEYYGVNKDNHTLWRCICDCGNEKITTGKSLRAGLCKSCGCLKSSGEELIARLLLDNNINFTSQFYFNDLRDYDKSQPLPLYFDFAIFENNQIKCLIEYQGEQHYHVISAFGGQKEFEERQKKDQLKRDYCNKHNLKLIEISYTDFNKIDINYLKEKINELSNQ